MVTVPPDFPLPPPLSPEFLKERRTLLVLCSLLTFAGVARPDFERLTILGAELHFAAPAAIFAGGWILWIYHVFRFIQFFSQEGAAKLHAAWGIASAAGFRDQVNRIAYKKCGRSIEVDPPYSAMARQYFFFRRYKATFGAKGTTVELLFGPHNMWRQYLAGWFRLAFGYTAGTDFLMPFAFCLIVLIWVGFGDWEGSLPVLAKAFWGS